MNNQLTLGDQVRIMRAVRNDMSQTQLAELAGNGLTTSNISWFENGRFILTTNQVTAIKAALSWPPDADTAFAILAAGNGDESQGAS